MPGSTGAGSSAVMLPPVADLFNGLKMDFGIFFEVALLQRAQGRGVGSFGLINRRLNR
jgi:hypothetical protein